MEPSTRPAPTTPHADGRGSGGDGTGGSGTAGRGTEASERLERVVVRAAVKILLITVATLGLIALAWRLRLLLLLVIVSVFIAVLVNPLVAALVRRGLRRSVAAVAVYVLLVIVGSAIGFMLVHPIYTSAIRFARELPDLVGQAQHGNGAIGHLVARLHLASYVKKHAPELESAISGLSKPALAIGRSVVSGIVSVVTIAFLSFFIVLEGPALFRSLLGVVSERRGALLRRTADAVTSQVTGFMAGNLATSAIAGIVVYVALLLTGVPFAGVLAIWVGLVDFLPLVGGLLAGVPAIGLAFVHSVPAGIVTVVVFIVYQQVENHVLYPLIVSRTVSLNPLFVLLAVLIGAETGSAVGSTFGAVVGALLAVPAAGSVQVAVREFLHTRREAAPSPPAAPD